ncbi:MAG: hypothetical protein QF464_24660, partial [Myxococcota bacterium]|nr:hypothetical protein [Myxococcota bacterium]
CGGCRARALARTGDVMGPDTSCAYEPTGDAPAVGGAVDATYGAAAAPTLQWAEDAQARIQRIPSFVRSVVVKRTEDYALRHGHTVITAALLDEIRSGMPIDFSKKRPFFMRPRGEDEDPSA